MKESRKQKHHECDYMQQQTADGRKRCGTYIFGNRKLSITEKNGKLTAEWKDI